MFLLISEFYKSHLFVFNTYYKIRFRPGARDTEEGVIATENAIAAVAKILKYGQINIDPTQVEML